MKHIFSSCQSGARQTSRPRASVKTTSLLYRAAGEISTNAPCESAARAGTSAPAHKDRGPPHGRSPSQQKHHQKADRPDISVPRRSAFTTPARHVVDSTSVSPAAASLRFSALSISVRARRVKRFFLMPAAAKKRQRCRPSPHRGKPAFPFPAITRTFFLFFFPVARRFPFLQEIPLTPFTNTHTARIIVEPSHTHQARGTFHAPRIHL